MSCIPLTEAEIDHANRLFEMVEGFTATVEAMDLIRERLPGFDLPTCLVKFAAVNTLYGTFVFVTVRMAKHIRGVMSGVASGALGPELVDRLSELPAENGEKNAPRLASFASKFAHFFVSPETFPILDRFVEMSLKHHLGESYTDRPGERYQKFFERVQLLRACNRLEDVPYRSLDVYLWIEGQWLTWCKSKRENKKTTVNTEIKKLFLEGHYKDDC